jgi:hypothetical protein
LLASRKPTARERDILKKLYTEQLAIFRADPEAASKLAGTVEAAALTVCVQAIFNSDPVIWKR